MTLIVQIIQNMKGIDMQLYEIYIKGRYYDTIYFGVMLSINEIKIRLQSDGYKNITKVIKVNG